MIKFEKFPGWDFCKNQNERREDMGVWQIIWCIIMALSLGISLSKHGERETGTHNFWRSLLALGIHVFLLYKGGFFG